MIASNQPEQFDWAVNDRLDEMVEFALPGEVERERILLQYFREFIVDPATSGARRQRLKLADFDWISKLKAIAKQTKGMSGRELSKLVFGWQVSGGDQILELVLDLSFSIPGQCLCLRGRGAHSGDDRQQHGRSCAPAQEEDGMAEHGESNY